MTNTTAALNLKLIAAMAEKMAQNVEQNKLWPGDLNKAVAQMRQWLAEVRE